MRFLITVFVLFTLVASAQEHHSIFPEPAAYKELSGTVTIPKTLSITDNETSREIKALIQTVFKKSNQELIYSSDTACFIQLIATNTFSEEQYQLGITPRGITIHYAEKRGLCFALQSIRQLIQEDKIPLVTIDDKPAYSYRGVHLDCSRHFFSISEIKQFLDELAYLKFNTFHWHLTDDQGWRLEIKKYPLLTTIGAWRDSTLIGHYRDQPWKFDRTRTGGFYTQEEAREIVRYASALGIEVIPEIELPGHARAALAAYPNMGCTGKQFPVASVWGVFEEVFCTKDETLQLLKDVLTEVAAIFPSKYIHIGGDEVPKTQWNACSTCQANMRKYGLKDAHELQSYVITSMEKHLNTLGKSMIGWDEILEGGLAPNATVMSWRGMEGGQAAAAMGHHVIMTPTTYCYFDYYQSDHTQEPLAIGGYLPLEKVYAFDPTTGVSEENKHYILGGQANLWSEYLSNFKQVQYHAFPRLAAMAEVLWNTSPLPYPAFVDALVKSYLPHLKTNEINYSNAFLDPKSTFSSVDGGIFIAPQQTLALAQTTINGEKKNGVMIARSNTVDTVAIHFQTTYLGASRTLAYQLISHAALGIPVVFTTPPHPKYNMHGNLGLTDGIIGNKPWKGSEWLGFETDTVQFELELPEEINISALSLFFLHDPASWIYKPEQIYIEYFSKNGKKRSFGLGTVFEKTTITRMKKVKKIRFTIINNSQIPAGQPGAGFTPWTFISEVLIVK